MLSPKENLARTVKHRRVESAPTPSSAEVSKDPKVTKTSPNILMAPTSTTKLDANLLHLAVSNLFSPVPSDTDYYAEALKVVLIV